MSVTQKGRGWDLRHSIWIAWTLFPLGLFGWISFFWAGFRMRERKLFLYGLIYSIPFIYAMSSDQIKASGAYETVNGIAIVLSLILWIASIVHALRIRKEYLLTLEARSINAAARKTSETEELKRRIAEKESSRNHTGHQRPQDISDRTQTGAAPPTAPTDPWASFQGDTHVKATVQPLLQSNEGQSLLDVNRASRDQISRLPGMGPILAQRTVDLRAKTGGFESVDELGVALGLKPHVIERLRPLVSFSPLTPLPSSDGRRVVDY